MRKKRKESMKTLIKNIGLIVSGDIARPLLDADSIVIADGKLAAAGRGLDADADTVIDAKGSAVIPGLIDSHCHPVFGDFTPRQRTMDFIESGLNGGLTTMISAGEVHLPGRPKDIVGLKALAVVATKAYANLRPAGVKVHGGAPILELGMIEEDFAEMAKHGVKLVGEIGLGSVKTGQDAAPMVRWAKKHGMTVTIHTGGPSIARSTRWWPPRWRWRSSTAATARPRCIRSNARKRPRRSTASSSATTRRQGRAWCPWASSASSPISRHWAASAPRWRSAWPRAIPRACTRCPSVSSRSGVRRTCVSSTRPSAPWARRRLRRSARAISLVSRWC